MIQTVHFSVKSSQIRSGSVHRPEIDIYQSTLTRMGGTPCRARVVTQLTSTMQGKARGEGMTSAMQYQDPIHVGHVCSHPQAAYNSYGRFLGLLATLPFTAYRLKRVVQHPLRVRICIRARGCLQRQSSRLCAVQAGPGGGGHVASNASSKNPRRACWRPARGTRTTTPQPYSPVARAIQLKNCDQGPGDGWTGCIRVHFVGRVKSGSGRIVMRAWVCGWRFR